MRPADSKAVLAAGWLVVWATSSWALTAEPPLTPSGRESLSALGPTRSSANELRRMIDQETGRLRQETRLQLEEVESDLRELVEESNRLSSAQGQRIYQLTSFFQILAGVLILLLGGMISAWMALWQRVRTLEREAARPEPLRQRRSA